MKFTKSVILKTLGMAMIAMPLAPKAMADSTLKQIEIKNCAEKGSPCMKITAPTAQGGSVRPLYVLKDLTLEIDGSKKETIQSPQGYIDFENNQVVLQNLDKNGTLTEQVFNLKTLERRTYVTK